MGDRLLLPPRFTAIEVVNIWGKDFDGVAELVIAIATLFLSLSIYFYMMFSMNKAHEIIKVIKRDYEYFMNRPENVILQQYTEEGRKVFLFYIIYFYSSLGIYLLLPYLPHIIDLIRSTNQTFEKKLIFDVHIGNDNGEYYYYYMTAYLYSSATIAVTIIVSYDTMYITYIQHACALFTILSYQLKTVHMLNSTWVIKSEENHVTADHTSKNITSSEQKIIHKKFMYCIKQHKNVLIYVNLLEILFTVPLFIQIFFHVSCLSITGLSIVLKLDDIKEVFRNGSFAAAQIIHLFLLCFPGQRLVNHSEKLYDAICKTMWYIFPTETIILYKLLLLRSSKSSKLTAIKMVSITLETFLTVFQTTVSYFTVFLSFL